MRWTRLNLKASGLTIIKTNGHFTALEIKVSMNINCIRLEQNSHRTGQTFTLAQGGSRSRCSFSNEASLAETDPQGRVNENKARVRPLFSPPGETKKKHLTKKGTAAPPREVRRAGRKETRPKGPLRRQSSSPQTRREHRASRACSSSTQPLLCQPPRSSPLGTTRPQS